MSYPPKKTSSHELSNKIAVASQDTSLPIVVNRNATILASVCHNVNAVAYLAFALWACGYHCANAKAPVIACIHAIRQIDFAALVLFLVDAQQ